MTRSVRWLWWAAVVVVAALPWLISAALLQRSSATWADLTPFSGFSSYPHLTDELFYWHQAASFRVAGFEAGYYTVNEQPASAGTPYFAWGITTPAFYGLLSSFSSWSLYALPLYNLAVLSLGIALAAAVLRLSIANLLLLGISVVFYAPFIMFHFVSMLPILELGLAAILGTALLAYLSRPSKPRFVTLIAVTAGLALLRPTWALILLLIAVVCFPRRHIFPVVLVMLGVNIVVWGFMFYTSAPYPDTLSLILQIASESPVQALTIASIRVLERLADLTRGTSVELYFRVTVLALVLVLVFARHKLRANIAAKGTPDAGDVRAKQAITIVLVHILLITLLLLTVYEVHDWRDFRLLAPFVWLGVFVLIVTHQRNEAFLMCGVMVIGLPAAWNLSHEIITAKTDPTTQQEYHHWKTQFEQLIQYEPHAASGWCNTAAYSIGFVNSPTLLAAIPPGVGMTMLLDSNRSPFLTFPLRARWLLLQDGFFGKYQNQLNVERLMTVPDGALYRNLDSPCETTQPPEASPSG